MKSQLAFGLSILAGMLLLASCSEEAPSEVHVKKKSAAKLADENSFALGENFEAPKLSLKQAFDRYSQNPNSNDYMQAALAALKQQDYLSAETLLNEVLRRDENNGLAYYHRGRARYNAISGADQAALDDLQKGVNLGVRDSNAYKFMARIYDSQKKTDKAIESLDTAIRINPNEKDSYKYRAAMCVALGQKEKALKDYDKALEFDRADTDMYFLRAQLLESMNREDRAMADYEKVVTLRRRKDKLSISGMAYKRLAALLSERGKHQEAIKFLTTGMDSDRTDEELIRLRGQQYMEMKMYERAISDFDKAISMSPEFAKNTYLARADAYDKIGNKKLADADRAEAKRLQDKPAEKPVFELGKDSAAEGLF